MITRTLVAATALLLASLAGLAAADDVSTLNQPTAQEASSAQGVQSQWTHPQFAQGRAAPLGAAMGFTYWPNTVFVSNPSLMLTGPPFTSSQFFPQSVALVTPEEAQMTARPPQPTQYGTQTYYGSYAGVTAYGASPGGYGPSTLGTMGYTGSPLGIRVTGASTLGWGGTYGFTTLGAYGTF